MSLTPAEINIKNHIIRYPDLFQSRLDVLKFVLLTDPESSWAPDGTIHSLRISTLDDQPPKLNTSHLSQTPSELSALCSTYTTPMQIYTELELAKYAVIERHLDTLVKVAMPNDKPMSDIDVRQINEYSLIFHVPDNVESSWLVAVREILRAAIIGTKQVYCKHPTETAHIDHWVYPFAFETYHKLQAQEQHFMPKIVMSPETEIKLRELRKLLG